MPLLLLQPGLGPPWTVSQIFSSEGTPAGAGVGRMSPENLQFNFCRSGLRTQAAESSSKYR